MGTPSDARVVFRFPNFLYHSSARVLAVLGSEVATPEQMTAKGFADFINTDYEAMRAAAKLAGIQQT